MKKGFVVVLLFVGLVGGSFVRAEEAAVKTPAVTAAPAAATLSVTDFAFCKSVETRQPVDKAEVFAPEVGKVYLWATITGATEPTEVKHVWYFNSVKVAEISIAVKYPRYRLWSYKTILPEQIGDWKVDIVDAAGNVIKSATFKIQKAEAPKQ
ncbi:MAG: DUF2914 domain-containing protein [Elusimicrobia bacterium]|nr:DUF2914 domain-containing protein [Elusimicrobiota bacterium]